MFLYDYIFYVVTKLMVPLGTDRVPLVYVLYPLRNAQFGDIIVPYNNEITLFSKLNSLIGTENFWWQFLRDPRLVASTLVFLLCILFIVEISFILPFRAFKRLVRYPNRNLMTPGEYRRSKRR